MANLSSQMGHKGVQQPTAAVGDKHTTIVVDGVEVGLNYIFGYGKRLTKRQRIFAIKCLVKRDGNCCQICKAELQDPCKADIDHVDGDWTHHIFYNMRLACHPCNSSMNVQQRSVIRLKEREKQGVAVGAAFHIGVDGVFSPSQVILIRSERNESLFRRIVFEKVKEKDDGNYYSSDALRKIGRAVTGCSRASSYSYMEKLLVPRDRELDENTRKLFPIIEDVDSFSKERFCKFTDPKLYTMTVEQIELLYPMSGQQVKKRDEMK